MEDKFRIKVKELQVGSKFSMSPHDRETLTITDIDDDVAYCTHFFGMYVLPLERFVYLIIESENNVTRKAI